MNYTVFPLEFISDLLRKGLFNILIRICEVVFFLMTAQRNMKYRMKLEITKAP